MNKFSQNLAHQRQRRGLSVAEAAKLCRIGRTTWHGYENGNATPTLAKLLLIADRLGTTASHLLKGVQIES